MASMDDLTISGPGYSLYKTLQTPSHISSLAFGHAGHLFAGSDDGSLRVYDLSTFKVLKAIRGLRSEVSSIVCLKRPGSELRDVWLACGRQALKFQMDVPKMILTAADTLSTIELGETDDDILNELALNSDKSFLAFSMDSGVVGVVELSNATISRMKSKHESICGSVKFIPNRPRELVSGGYDTALLHFDFHQGTILSRRDIPPYINKGGMALSPPFIMSTALSQTGIIAAGTADGRLWLGFGGEKRPTPGVKAKRSRKWEGLKDEDELLLKAAEGPIVAMAFSDSGTLTISTLLGVITEFELEFNVKEGSVVVDKLWQTNVQNIEKVNALVVDDRRIIVGGFSKEAKGIIEIWVKNTTKS